MSYISALRKGEEVWVWERTEEGRRVVRYPAPYYFFLEDERGPYTSIFGDKLERHEFETYEEFQQARSQARMQGVRIFESDLSPELKLLSQKYYNVPAPKLHVTFLDIEVDYNKEIGFSSVDNPYAPINSIAMYNQWENRMVLYAIPPDDQTWTEEKLHAEMQKDEPFPDDIEVEVYLCKNETDLLLHILGEIEESDVLCGWNSDFFDVPYIAKRLERSTLGNKAFKRLSFDGAPAPRYRDVEKFKKKNITIDLYGRISCDYLALFKKYEMAERPSYKLENISDEILPELPKLEYEGSLHDLYRKDFPWFCRYNLRDTEVLKGFEEKLGYVALANEMYHLSTGLWKHVGGTLKLAELAINNYCNHELNLQFPDTKEPDISGSIAGAFVLLPQVGLHERIGSIDINSLYPSAIRSINVSPEKIIGQFDAKVKASQEVAKGSMVSLSVEYEDGSEEVHTADEWRDICRERKWSVSGYGTIFNQDAKGIIPAILENWYATRKQYQAKMRAEKDPTLKGYYNRLQYVYKIKLNSLYGALTNAYFRYYDLRMGESTTGTGRMILLHQCAKVNEVLDGEYSQPDRIVIEKDPNTGKDKEHFGYSDLWSVLYGDTDSSYFATHADSDEEAIVVADYVSMQVNDSFQEFMRETFLCQPEFDDIIKCGREIVADRGIFVDKKRYIIHTINNEGEKVDKLKVMGLDTKKTTIPAHVGKTLNQFIGRLLAGEDWDSIAKDIVEFKKWIETTDDIMAIGLPRGVNAVEDYTNRWETDKSTRLPGHVAAAIHYNQCRKKYNDHESLEINTGMKIKVFYLTQKHGYFKSIALPTDLNEVPQWFLDNFSINRSMHVERLVDNPLGNIIKAIEKEVPTQQSLIVDDLLSF